MANFRRIIAAGLAVTTLGMGVATPSTPAAAWGYYHGGWVIITAAVAGALAELPPAWRWAPLPPLPLLITMAMDIPRAASCVSRSSTSTALLSVTIACAFTIKTWVDATRNLFRQYCLKTSSAEASPSQPLSQGLPAAGASN
jgi:hypothetical protein